MLKRDVTKSAVIIIIAVSMATLSLDTGPPDDPSVAQASPRARKWMWENATVVVSHDLEVREGETFVIRNSNVEMDTSRNSISISVRGFLLVENSVIRDIGENGYHFHILGAAEIVDSRIEGVKSTDPIGEGMIISPGYIRIKGSTIRSYDNYAVTFYYPHINPEMFVVDSDIGGVSIIQSYINMMNSTLGNLHFRYGPGELNLYNCAYSSARVENAAFGYIYSWRYVQVHTSEPNSDVTITNADESMKTDITTDEDGNYADWWLSNWMTVDPVPRTFVNDYNPFTFEANKIVTREFVIHGGGWTIPISCSLEYSGTSVQDLEVSSMVNIELEPVVRLIPSN